MIFDEIHTLRTINEAPNDFTVKFFLYIAVNQPQDGIKGYTIEKSQLNYDLNLRGCGQYMIKYISGEVECHMN